ncbi:RdgB/HAM1 family non-canonical purine NTP pyrophosphatase [Larkinella humicola]|uniref:dITP/XTP pyrophosphatase n=1 Tax=Larkinella humicola TaxID=2607654 RepID=A0A5N1JIL3_9BACT|nr:RdgB/HAM1 family non-canonical purine NTP pyrophosphatase [Larkinella humicola]KAA9355215.1 RdgB/HAM1 family non-canonical purine NTP pyrophosphatase [Larkinella humicola]
MTLCFATNNANKLAEIAALLGDQFTLKTLQDIGCFEEIPETQDTIPGNSRQKAEHVWDHYHVNCFADDSGLEVDALDGAPGVHSAYYGGHPRSYERNLNLLLTNLKNQTNRRARFRTVITLVIDGQYWSFEGNAEGQILTEPRGTGGFGYDPIFQPDGHDRTFAEMSMEEKGDISHRGKAFAKLVAFLNELPPNS